MYVYLNYISIFIIAGSVQRIKQKDRTNEEKTKVSKSSNSNNNDSNDSNNNNDNDNNNDNNNNNNSENSNNNNDSNNSNSNSGDNSKGNDSSNNNDSNNSNNNNNNSNNSNSSNNNNNKNNPPLLSRALSAPTISPSKAKPMQQPIKKKSAPVNYNKFNTKESRSIMNSNPKSTKVTATASSTADGLTTIATISVSISAASSSTTNRSQNASNSRLFNKNKDRQFTPYQKPAIGFASRKFKTRIPDSTELNYKINTYANKLIEDLTGVCELAEKANEMSIEDK